jgi:hypothetical protein
MDLADLTSDEKELVKIACEVGNIANQLPTGTVQTNDPDVWLDYQVNVPEKRTNVP